MSRDLHARVRRSIDDHFALAGGPGREREMRAHLPGCRDCHRHYQRHLLLARLQPAGTAAHVSAHVSAEDRLARTLGFPVSARRAPGPRLPLGFAALLGTAVAASVLLLIGVPRRAPPAGEYAARGLPAAAQAPELLVYRIPHAPRAFGDRGVPLATAGAVRADDELAFAYRNPGGRRYVMVFGVDEHGHVYWYHPEWSRADDDPSAVAVSTEPGLHELPAAVVQNLDGETLMIHALFTDRELTVREVEAAVAVAGVARAGQPGALGPEVEDVAQPLRVLR